ncbi:MAG: hypothetical protein QOG43_1612 [Actinomycetota bacterium]|jgi:tRNA G18 (ribose-2'-O)-methylase SpoU|nr:hypothetical protein [Actinomycetota bacterium]
MTYRLISDPADPLVADYVGLSDAEARRLPDGGIFVAEGALVIEQLVRSPYRVRSFLVTPHGLRAVEALVAAVDAPVYLATQDVMEAIVGFHFHRGALAAADRAALPDPADVAAGATRLLLVEGVSDNENLGALFRNAAAFGADGVLLDPTTADPLYRRSVRVSSGHVLRIPFARMPDWPERAMARLQAQGFEILALTPSPTADDLRSLPLAPGRRRALLVGTEGPGLSAVALSAADRRVRIAMSPGVDSLNVATAAAIALHHLETG